MTTTKQMTLEEFRATGINCNDMEPYCGPDHKDMPGRLYGNTHELPINGGGREGTWVLVIENEFWEDRLEVLEEILYKAALKEGHCDPTPINCLTVPEKFVGYAKLWYDGSASMLYAIASTGNLTTGGIRPRHYGRALTDQEWYHSLYQDLEMELYHILKKLRYSSVREEKDLKEFHQWAIETRDLLAVSYHIEI
jgi:hypothetical protein